jgi:hypothetical protein
MSRYVFALHIAGLRNPQDSTDASPILFTNGPLPTLPAEFSGWSVLPWIPVGGDCIEANWTSDPRQPIGDAGALTVQLLDDPTGALGRLFLRDSRTKSWELDQAQIAAASTGDSTAILATTKPDDAPVVSEVYYLEGEAVKVTASAGRSFGSGTSPISYTVTATRGQCGSLARTHRLDPALSDAGSDGTADRLYLDSRPNFDSYRFEAAIFLFQLDDFGAYATHHRRNLFVEEQPKPLKKGVYEVKLVQVPAYLESHPLAGKDRTLTLSRRVRVTGETKVGGHFARPLPGGGHVGFGTGTRLAPQEVQLYLTRQEAELLFREPLHKPGNPKLDETMAEDLASRLRAEPGTIEYSVLLEANGKWLFKIGLCYFNEFIPFGDTAKQSFFVVTGSLEDQSGDADLTPVAGAGFEEQQQIHNEQAWDRYLGAWTVHAGKLATEGGATISLRIQINASPIEAALYLLISDSAPDSGGHAYDRIVGRVGAGLNPAWLNLGAVQADPLDVEFGTTELLELNQILDEEFEYQIALKGGAKLGEWLNNICYLHTLLFGPLTDGTFTFRQWARPQEDDLQTLVAIARPVAPGSRLSVIRSLEVLSGYTPIDLEHEFTRSIRLKAPRLLKGKEEERTIRIWKRGNHATTQDVEAGPISNLVRSFLDLMGGAPSVYEVPIPIGEYFDLGLTFGDFVYWDSEEDLPTAEGFGFPDGATFLVTGLSMKMGAGEVIVRLVRDTFNDSQVTTTEEGLIAPTLRPSLVTHVSGLTYDVDVTSLGEAALNITTAHDGIWADYVSRDGLVHVTIPKHAAAGTTHGTERDGFLEAYATVDSVNHSGGTSTIRLTFDSAWERDGKTIADILVSGESFISLADRRLADTVPGGDLIEPVREQLHDGGAGINFIKVSGGTTIDRVRHRVGV